MYNSYSMFVFACVDFFFIYTQAQFKGADKVKSSHTSAY